jgi:hypothetical protein
MSAGMDATKVMTNHTPAIRAILLCCGDCSGEDIDIPAPACGRARDRRTIHTP